MKILLVSPQPLYESVPYAGGQTTYNIYKRLQKKCEVTLIYWGNHDESQLVEKEALFEQTIFCSRSKKMWIHVYRLLLAFFFYPLKSSRLLFHMLHFYLIGEHVYYGKLTSFYHWTLFNILKQISKKEIDIIVLEHAELLILAHALRKRVLISSQHDVLSNIEYFKNESISIFKKIRRLENCNSYFIQFVIVQSKKDFIYCTEHFRCNVLQVSPYVNTSAKRKNKKGDAIILFVGAFDREPNILSARMILEKIIPSVIQHNSKVNFLFVGNNPPKQLLQLREKWKRNVSFTEYVQDVNEYYAKATLFVCPHFSGGGVLVKFLTALYLGVPVIANAKANEGIGAVPGVDFYLAENPKQFVEAIISLLKNIARQKELAAHGRDFVEHNFNFEKSVEEIYGEFEQLCKRNQYH